MNEVQKRHLRELYTAAESRDLQAMDYLLKQLLATLPYYYSLAVTVETAHDFLEIFESYYPEATWARQVLIGIGAFGRAPDEEALGEAMQANAYPQAGAGNFVKALYDIAQAMSDRHTPEARVGFLVSALYNSVMAELAEAWYDEREAEWDILRHAPQSPEGQAVAHAFWMDGQTAALDRGAWHRIAQRIERAFARA